MKLRSSILVASMAALLAFGGVACAGAGPAEEVTPGEVTPEATEEMTPEATEEMTPEATEEAVTPTPESTPS